MAAGSVSIAKLFLAGIIPGFTVALVLMIYCYIVSKKRNYPKGDGFKFSVMWAAFKDALWGLFTIVIIMTGVLTGICTATEAAAIAVVWAIFVTFFVYKEISIKELFPILSNALRTLCTVMAIIGISSAFGWVLAYLKIPNMIMEAIIGITDNKIIILLLINLILLVLGMIMDMSSIIMIATPILLPIVTSVGMDPVQFGILMMLNLGIGLITPPVGGVLFVCSGITGLQMERLVKAMFPFYLVLGIALLLITFVPQFSLMLPNLVY